MSIMIGYPAHHTNYQGVPLQKYIKIKYTKRETHIISIEKLSSMHDVYITKGKFFQGNVCSCSSD